MLSFAKDARRIKGMSSKRANKCLQTTYKTAPILAAEEQLPACLPACLIRVSAHYLQP